VGGLSDTWTSWLALDFLSGTATRDEAVAVARRRLPLTAFLF